MSVFYPKVKCRQVIPINPPAGRSGMKTIQVTISEDLIDKYNSQAYSRDNLDSKVGWKVINAIRNGETEVTIEQ